jgi:hypothetical protein
VDIAGRPSVEQDVGHDRLGPPIEVVAAGLKLGPAPEASAPGREHHVPLRAPRILRAAEGARGKRHD